MFNVEYIKKRSPMYPEIRIVNNYGVKFLSTLVRHKYNGEWKLSVVTSEQFNDKMSDEDLRSNFIKKVIIISENLINGNMKTNFMLTDNNQND